MRLAVLALVGFAAALAAAPAAAPADSAYAGHPRLLFTAAGAESLRTQLHDGGDDDAAYAAIRTWAQGALALTPSQLLGGWEGEHSTGQLGLLAQVEAPGDTFAAKTRELVLYLVRNRTVSNDEFASALRLRTMALGYDMAFAGATPAERAEVRQAMRAYLDYMPPHFNYYCQAYNPYAGNHGMTVGSAMGLAAISLWDDVTAAGRDSLLGSLQFADQLVAKCSTDILPADGAYREGVLYGAWVMRMALPYFEARRRFDGTDLAADARFERVLTWLAYELSPEGGGRTNNLNDSPWSTRPLALHNTYLEWAQMRYGSPVARYLHDHVVGQFGYNYGVYADRVATALWCRPLPAANPRTLMAASQVFRERGLYYYRNGWNTGVVGDETVFSFFSGKFYGGHAQEDQNQFTLAAYGIHWATDCGGVGSSQTPKQSEAHNLVLVDGRGQHNAGNSIGTDGQIASTLQCTVADYVRGDASAAYATYSPFNAAGLPFPASDWSWGYDGGNPLERAGRLCLVVKGSEVPPYVLIGDDVRKDGIAHDFDWLLHASTVPAIQLAADPAQLVTPQATLDLFFAHPRPDSLALSWAPFVHGGVDPNTNRIVARAHAVEPRFFVALVPRPAGQPAPLYSALEDSGATTIVLDWGVVRDAAVFNPRHRATHGEIETDGAMAMVRHAGRELRGYLLGEGQSLRAGGLDLVTISGGLASVGLSGDTLSLSSAAVNFSAYGPAVVQVTSPEGPVLFRRDGDYVRNLHPVDASAIPLRTGLGVVRPNPARRGATVEFTLAVAASVRCTVHDVRGTRVTTLLDATLGPGTHLRRWDGRDSRGRRVAPGVYFVVLRTPAGLDTAKLVVAR